MTGTPSAPQAGQRGLPPGALLLLTAACTVIVVAGLKAASSLLIPVLVAGFFAVLCLPGMRRLQRLRLPTSLAVVVVMAVAALAVLMVVVVVGTSAARFKEELPNYQTDLEPIEAAVTRWLQARGWIDSQGAAQLDSIFDPGIVLDLVTRATSEVLSALSNLFVILLLMVFMLLEANGFGAKIHRALGGRAPVLEQMANIKTQVSSYISLKAAISLLTGLLVAAFTAIVGVDFAVLWGFVAFAFNFVPTVGSILAAIPAVLMALIQFGAGSATVVAAGYLALNVLVGNLLEPRIMGRRLGLSTLVVFLSLIFWSWVWGPIGMLLSVPLTVVVKIVFEHIEDLRPIAVLLGPGGEPDAGRERPLADRPEP